MNLKERTKIAAANLGDSVKKHKKGIIVCVSALLILALFFTALYFTGVFDDRANAIVELEAPELSYYESSSIFGGGDGYAVEIRGKIKNNIHATINLVSFRFELYDANGKLLTAEDGKPIYAIDSVQKLGGGKEYSYVAVTIVPKSTPMPLTFQVAKTDLR